MIEFANNNNIGWYLKDMEFVKKYNVILNSEQFHIKAVYETENENEVKTYTIDMPLDVFVGMCCVPRMDIEINNTDTECEFDLGFGWIKSRNADCKIDTKKKTKEMTINEIENILGHKIKIVGDSKND